MFLGMVDGSSFVDGSSLVSRGSSIVGLSRVLNISNISAVGISNLVVDGLGPAVREGYLVGSGGGVSITVLPGAELGARVVISNSVVVGVHSGLIVGGLLVGNGGLVGGGRGVVDGSSLVGGRRGVVDGGGLVDGGRDVSRGGLVDR